MVGLNSSGLVVVIYDITQLKEYEEASARRQRLSEMGNLAAGVAHEIRNPLNTISIAAQRLAMEFTPENNKENKVVELAQQYYRDAKYYLEKKDLFTAFGCINYAHGLLDALIKTK